METNYRQLIEKCKNDTTELLKEVGKTPEYYNKKDLERKLKFQRELSDFFKKIVKDKELSDFLEARSEAIELYPFDGTGKNIRLKSKGIIRITYDEFGVGSQTKYYTLKDLDSSGFNTAIQYFSYEDVAKVNNLEERLNQGIKNLIEKG